MKSKTKEKLGYALFILLICCFAAGIITIGGMLDAVRNGSKSDAEVALAEEGYNTDRYIVEKQGTFHGDGVKLHIYHITDRASGVVYMYTYRQDTTLGLGGSTITPLLTGENNIHNGYTVDTNARWEYREALHDNGGEQDEQ